MRYIFLYILFILVVSTNAQNFSGNPSSVKWKQIRNGKLRVIYPKGLDSQARHILSVMGTIQPRTSPTIGGTLRKWDIVMQSQSAVSNAYVRMAPRRSEFYMMPDQDNFESGTLRWDDQLATHEYRHIQQFSNFNKGVTKLFSVVLGEEGQLLANGMAVPDYFFEGDAVFQETLITQQGRGRLPNFFNGMNALSKAKKNYSWMKLRNGSLRAYTPDHYQYGYQLVAYGYEKYGPDFWKKVTEDAVRFKGLFYSFGNAIERYSGKNYSQFRKEAFEYFQEISKKEPLAEVMEFNFITPIHPNHVADYQYPFVAADGSLIVEKRSYREIPAFIQLLNGKETKIRVKDISLQDHYVYRNGKILYSAYQSDARWGNREYSNIKMIDVKTRQQVVLTQHTKYFSPDISPDGKQVLAVHVDPDGTNGIHLLDAVSGNIISRLPNPKNYFFTQTRFMDDQQAVSAIRDPQGRSTLAFIDLSSGEVTPVMPFSYNPVGNPYPTIGKIYFNISFKGKDRIGLFNMADRNVSLLRYSGTGVYSPMPGIGNEIYFSAFTADGYRLVKMVPSSSDWQSFDTKVLKEDPTFNAGKALDGRGKNVLAEVKDEQFSVKPYHKGLHLFRFHSWRPGVNDPEYSLTLLGDNSLNDFTQDITYTYNRSESSHSLSFTGFYGGWFPLLDAGVEASFNRNILLSNNTILQCNTARVFAGIQFPLSFVTGRSYMNINFGSNFNAEQLLYLGIGKNIFNNLSFNYTSSFFHLSNSIQKAKQQINPRWAQSISFNYRDASTLRLNHKLVGSASFYVPGFFGNHSIVLDAAYQKRDTMGDLFSRTFPYSRGYEALDTRRMYKLGVNYHFPLFYPDWGFGNLVYVQRVRANGFYDYTNAKARVNGVLTEIQSRSAGAEIYLDGKIWNEYPVSIGFRWSHLLDVDLVNPTRKEFFEFVVPVGLVPR